MKKTMNAATLMAMVQQNKAATNAAEPAEFLADDIVITATNAHTGDVLFSATARSRGFKPAESGRNKGKGGIGWYVSPGSGKSDGGSYVASDGTVLALTSGIRISVKGVKLDPNADTVDVRCDAQVLLDEERQAAAAAAEDDAE